MRSWQLFIRHAHRDTVDRDLDNGLDDKGRKQGKKLVEYLATAHPRRKPKRVFSSPKARCVETAEFVARWAGVKVEIDDRIAEQNVGIESDRAFTSRLQNFYESTCRDSGVCYVSHGDVLPLLTRLMGEPQREIRKGDLFWLVDGHIEEPNAVHSSGNKK